MRGGSASSGRRSPEEPERGARPGVRSAWPSSSLRTRGCGSRAPLGVVSARVRPAGLDGFVGVAAGAASRTRPVSAGATAGGVTAARAADGVAASPAGGVRAATVACREWLRCGSAVGPTAPPTTATAAVTPTAVFVRPACIAGAPLVPAEAARSASHAGIGRMPARRRRRARRAWATLWRTACGLVSCIRAISS